MKLNEFKAWFDGYTENLGGPPSKKQWERIKEQVAAIDGTPVSYPVYVDRYYQPYRRWYDWGLNADARSGNDLRAYATALKGDGGTVLSQNSFDGVAAMYAAGKAEALAA